MSSGSRQWVAESECEYKGCDGEQKPITEWAAWKMREKRIGKHWRCNLKREWERISWKACKMTEIIKSEFYVPLREKRALNTLRQFLERWCEFSCWREAEFDESTIWQNSQNLELFQKVFHIMHARVAHFFSGPRTFLRNRLLLRKKCADAQRF